jgi:hypothetical protein
VYIVTLLKRRQTKKKIFLVQFDIKSGGVKELSASEQFVFAQQRRDWFVFIPTAKFTTCCM